MLLEYLLHTELIKRARVFYKNMLINYSVERMSSVVKLLWPSIVAYNFYFNILFKIKILRHIYFLSFSLSKMKILRHIYFFPFSLSFSHQALNVAPHI